MKLPTRNDECHCHTKYWTRKCFRVSGLRLDKIRALWYSASVADFATSAGKTALLLGFALISAFAQSPTPTFVQAGKLSCAARRLAPNQLQLYCKLLGTETVVFNSVQPLRPGHHTTYQWDQTTGEPEASLLWDYTFDSTSGAISWSANYSANGKAGVRLAGSL